MQSIKIRPATIDDSLAVFEWRNDPLTISTSRSNLPVIWETHQDWFPEQISNWNTVCLIGECEQTMLGMKDLMPCGVVWFRHNRSQIWETGVNLSPNFRGQKLSIPMLTAAMDWMRTERRAKQFSTEVKDDNHASIKMFETCGFRFIHPSNGFSTYCTNIL